jgi:hypothetical protein
LLALWLRHNDGRNMNTREGLALRSARGNFYRCLEMFTDYRKLSKEFSSLFERASNNSILRCNAQFTPGVDSCVARCPQCIWGPPRPSRARTLGRNHAPLGIRIQSSMTAVCVVIVSLVHFIPTQGTYFLLSLSSIYYLLYSLPWVSLLPPATNDSDARLPTKAQKSTTITTV